MTSNQDNIKKEKLLQLVRDAVKLDHDLRTQYHMGEKFRFIRDRLNALKTRVEEQLLAKKQIKKEELKFELLADEVFVYVHLFNAQGLNLHTWHKMLNPAVFYDHSINRPAYRDKSQIDAFIRSKSDKAQHGYLTFAIKKTNIIVEGETKDIIGHPLVKVKEGSYQLERLVGFTHNSEDYVLSEAGELIKRKH